ncbi:Uncharacterised protein [Sphingobacterium spiritivorum]|uniref:DNA methylase n=1 Tax=Sphingobacterium spiritivorum TaxID=258 RepID=A0A380CES7_SPHSI|nr:hypothetical protein [Sphingobacterium spiritivorum]SUJ19205.1 Uncharacterised protein [Sphingobacterium spiritivorum]
MELSKYISSESVQVNRSQISFADYNPRTISESAKKKLKANIKRLGVMGGIVWNERTGNIVGGHQKVKILDELHGYSEDDKSKDYVLTVEKVNLSPKEEKEQNLFLNNKSAQGETDNDLLAMMITDIDYDLAGLDKFDLQLAGIELPSLDDDIHADIDPFETLRELEKVKSPSDKKQDIQAKKEAVREKAINDMAKRETYVTLVFNSAKAKEQFMNRFNFDPTNNIIQGEDFDEMIEMVY